MSRTAAGIAEQFRASNLRAALVILQNLEAFPPESLAHRWAALVVRADKQERRAA